MTNIIQLPVKHKKDTEKQIKQMNKVHQKISDTLVDLLTDIQDKPEYDSVDEQDFLQCLLEVAGSVSYLVDRGSLDEEKFTNFVSVSISQGRHQMEDILNEDDE